MIDVHVHFNEPGRAEWEGAATGSRALAAGGGTTFFDMPLNSTPCTVTSRDFDAKREALERTSIVDFGLWGSLVPGAVAHMPAMAARGVIGFKAFLCDSGLSEFPTVDERTLFRGLEVAEALRLPVAVHAESQALITPLPLDASVREFLDSRPIRAELEAVERVLRLAGQTGARLHLVHVSSSRSVAAAAEARALGVDVSIETCPHYLFFDEEDVERLGAVAKCAPPVRSAVEREALWNELITGRVDIVASDHSPVEPALKGGEFSRAWAGIAGIQSTLDVLLDAALTRNRLALERISALVATTPARRFGLAQKGRLEPGADADITLVDLAAAHTLQAQDLHQRHKQTPYVGSMFRASVRRTICRGQTIYNNGRITACGGGRLVRPNDREH